MLIVSESTRCYKGVKCFELVKEGWPLCRYKSRHIGRFHFALLSPFLNTPNPRTHLLTIAYEGYHVYSQGQQERCILRIRGR